VAPFSLSASVFETVRLKTVALNPAFMQCSHILRPMTPVPIQPMRVVPGVISTMLILSLQLLSVM
jgi:hypothetical protein